MRYLLTLIIAFLLLSCGQRDSNQNYINKINSWHQKRVEKLTQPDSWLSLAGLYWLPPGVNTFGSDSTNDLIFPSKAPANIGKFIVNDSTVRVQIDKNIPVFSLQGRVHNMELKTDSKGEPTVLNLGSLSWYIIERSNRLAIRLKDSKNKALTNFKGIERFLVDKKWHVKATFQPFNHTKKIAVPTITGSPTQMTAPGLLKFSLSGHSYTLRPLKGSPDDGKFFIIFGDETNGQQTYDGGRFLYVAVPGKDGITYIDFNKAYNPPCAFTKFATCPLPTPRNHLSVKIKAGEKKYDEHV